MTSALSTLLTQTGGKSFKFTSPGDTVTGTVVAADVVQKNNFDTGQPEFWSDGQPIQQVRITLATELREDAEDDGHRNVYVKAWGDQLRGLRAAIKAAGAADVLPGGTFTATYTGDGELAAGKRGFPPKLYAYSYTAPSATAGLLGGGDNSTAAAPPAPSAATAPTAMSPAQQTAAAQPTPEQLAAFAAYQASLQQNQQ